MAKRADWNYIRTLCSYDKQYKRLTKLPLLVLPKTNSLDKQISKKYNDLYDKHIKHEVDITQILGANTDDKTKKAIIDNFSPDQVQMIEAYIKKGLIYEADELMKTLIDENVLASQHEANDLYESILFILDEFPEDHFVLLNERVWNDTYRTKANFKYDYSEIKKQDTKLTISYLDKSMLKSKIKPEIILDKNTIPQLRLMRKGENLLNFETSPYDKHEIQIQRNQMFNSQMSELVTLVSVIEAAYEDAQYVVAQRRKLPPNHAKQHHAGPYNREDLVSLVFLNRLKVSTPLPAKGGHHASPRPHARKGTWYTLRAKRYQNHPKYGKEKACFRRPAWVGPKEEIVNGITYTIL